MADVDVLLDTARAARARSDWRTAYSALTAAQKVGVLDLDDLVTLGEAAWWVGPTKDALCTSESVFHRLVGAGLHERAGAKAVELALLWVNRGDFTIGSGWLNRAQRTLLDLPECAAHGYLRYLQSWFALMGGDVAQAVAEGARLQDMGTRFDAPVLASLGLLLNGTVDIGSCRAAEGFAQLDEAMLPVLAGQVEPLWAGEIYCTVIHYCHQLADTKRMWAWTDALEQWLADIPDAVMIEGVCRIHRFQLRRSDCVLADIERELAAVCGDLTDRNVFVAAEGFVALGDIRRLHGDVDGAAAAYARSRELGGDPQPGDALLHLAAGRIAPAATALRAALGSADGYARARLLAALVSVELIRGDLAEAESCCVELESIAERYGTAGFRAWARHARGAVLVDRGDFVAATTALQLAAREYREQHARYELGQVYELLARAHRGCGDAEVADADVATALAIYRRLGAEPDVRRLARDTNTPGGLTPREIEILSRIALGASNKEVAAETFISEKTVGRHLANIYLKIGVTSRTAAAAWARANSLA